MATPNIREGKEERAENSHPTPILPTEGVAVGTIVVNSYNGAIDPSTGQDISVIKTGKCSGAGSVIDGRPKPDKLGSTVAPELVSPSDPD